MQQTRERLASLGLAHAELRELASDIGFSLILQERAGAIFDKAHHGAAFRVPSHPAVAFAGNPVAVRRVEVRELDLA